MRNANSFQEPSYFRDRNPHTNLHHITEKKNRGTKKSAIIFIHLLLFWPDLISTSRTMWILEEWEQSRKMQLLCKQMQLLWKKRKLLCKKYAIIVQTKQFLLHKKYNWCELKKNTYCAKKCIYCGKKTIVVQKKNNYCGTNTFSTKQHACSSCILSCHFIGIYSLCTHFC